MTRLKALNQALDVPYLRVYVGLGVLDLGTFRTEDGDLDFGFTIFFYQISNKTLILTMTTCILDCGQLSKDYWKPL